MALSLLVLQLAVGADMPPPFHIDFNVRQREFGPAEERTMEFQVTVRCSNAWWRIDAWHRSVLNSNVFAVLARGDPPGFGTSDGSWVWDGTRFVGGARGDSCMTVPGGIRTVHLFYRRGAEDRDPGASANAFPLACPHPSQIALLSSWLAGCRKPRLPLVDSRTVRRLSYVLVETDLAPFSDPRNIGTFGIEYLAPAPAFVSSLNITNDGTSIESEWRDDGPPGVAYHRWKAPADRGWHEFEYQVLAATNRQGFKFPLRTVTRYLLPTGDGDTLRLRPRVQVDIETVRIGDFHEPGIGDVQVPDRLEATDWRPPWDTTQHGFNRWITNDVWELAKP